MDVDDIVRARIEAARRKATEEKKARAAFAAARSKGLARRHAAKLRHLAETAADTTKAPGLASPEASNPSPTPQTHKPDHWIHE
ncbi:hypothetical protein [Streptomyces sp. NPDC054849]